MAVRRAVVGLFPLLMGASGCREVATTQLLVVVDTNLSRSEGLTEVHVEVQDPDGGLQQERNFDLAPSGRVQFPFSFGVVPRGADEGRRVRVIAEARTANGETVVRRSALCGFFPDTILRLPLFLPDICRGLQCPPGTTCRGDARECVSDAVDLNRLERLSLRSDGAEFDGSTTLPFVDVRPSDDRRSDARADGPVVRHDGPRRRGLSADPHHLRVPLGDADARATVSTAAPRLIAPLSLGAVTSLRPTLRWVRPAGADSVRVELCEDRGCTRALGSFMSTADAQAPATPLAPGRVVYWRALPLSAGAVSGPASAVWYFRTPRGSSASTRAGARRPTSTATASPTWACSPSPAAGCATTSPSRSTTAAPRGCASPRRRRPRSADR